MVDYEPLDIKGMAIRRNQKNKYVIVSCFFYADPKKDPDRVVCKNPDCPHWIEDVKMHGETCPECKEGKMHKRGQDFFDTVISPLSHLQQRVEFFIDWTAKVGKRVYAQFSQICHTGTHKAPDRAIIYRGWDFGQHHPAVVVCYDNTLLNRFEVLYAFLGYNITFRPFCKEIVEWCDEFWPRVRFLEGIDPHGLRKSGHGATIDEESDTNASYMEKRYDMDLDWNECFPTEGRAQVAELITARPVDADGVYPFSINITDTTVLYHREPNTKIIGGNDILIKGMNGSYRFSRKADGTYSKDPVKNIYSHPCDALMHAILRARGVREDSSQDEEIQQFLLAGDRTKPGFDHMGGPSF